MSRTSRGAALTWPVSILLIFDPEQSSFSATWSIVSPAASRRRLSVAPRRWPRGGLRRAVTCRPPRDEPGTPPTTAVMVALAHRVRKRPPAILQNAELHNKDMA